MAIADAKRTLAHVLPRTLPRLARWGLSILVVLGATTSLEAQRSEERRHLRHILVRTEADADMILKKLDEGESFKSLARKYSLDTVTKIIGGDLGEQGPIWEPSFNEAAFGIEEINGVTKAKSGYGWHVIQLLGKRKVEVAGPARTLPSTRPKTPPKPRVRGDFNKDLTVEAEFAKAAHRPGEDVMLTMRITNETDGPLNVFNPELWPLGLIIRYQSGPGPLNRDLRPPSGDQPPAGGFFHELAGKQTLERKFRLQDYLEDELDSWPIIRSIWRGDVFFRNLQALYPELAQEADFATWKARWRYYASEDNHLNILPPYKKGDRWFALFYVRGLVWVELSDPGVPGLLEKWIELVRNGHYRRAPFTENVVGSHLSCQVNAEDQPSVEPLTVTSFTPQKLTRGSLSLYLEKGSQGGQFNGRFDFSLTNGPQISSQSVKIGDVFKGILYLDQTSNNFAASRRRPELSLVNVYPEALLPDDIKRLASVPLTDRKQQDETSAAAVSQVPRSRTAATNPVPARPTFAPDLPRVRFETDRGSFILELFEDHAPNTVANFLNLIESGFYNGKTFHRRIQAKGNRGLIQTGKDDAGPTYTIRDEISPQLKHERGSVAMAVRSRLERENDPRSSVIVEPNTACTEFYICLEEQPQLDGKDTIFGRLISGEMIVDRIQVGSVITRASVLRKRPQSAYTVEKIERKGS